MTPVALRATIPAKKKPTAAELQALMEDQLGHGEIHRWDPATGKTPRYWIRSPTVAARQVLLENLDAVDEPSDRAEQYPEARRRSTRPASLVRMVLEELVAEGKCRRYDPLKADQFRYWAGDPDKYYRGVILQALAKGKGKAAAPMTLPELAKALKAPLKGVLPRPVESDPPSPSSTPAQAFTALRFLAEASRKRTARSPRPRGASSENRLPRSTRSSPRRVSYRSEVDRGRARPCLERQIQAKAQRPPRASCREPSAELKREKYGHTGLRADPRGSGGRSLRARLGSHAASVDVLDETIKALVKDGTLNIIPLNDATGVSVDDRNDGIPGSQETWYYLESRS